MTKGEGRDGGVEDGRYRKGGMEKNTKEYKRKSKQQQIYWSLRGCSRALQKLQNLIYKLEKQYSKDKADVEIVLERERRNFNMSINKLIANYNCVMVMLLRESHQVISVYNADTVTITL